MPVVGDRFATRHALVTVVSLASHSLGYRAVGGYHSTAPYFTVGCPLNESEGGQQPCTARVVARLVDRTELQGQWELVTSSMLHNHEPTDQGMWKAPTTEVSERARRAREAARVLATSNDQASQKGKGWDEAQDVGATAEQAEEIYQLEPIPLLSSTTNLPMTAEEKRCVAFLLVASLFGLLTPQ
jgi:hypothetical protein